MARIKRIEMRLVDIPPKVKRTDAIQSFVKHETPIVTVTDADGAVGVGYRAIPSARAARRSCG